MGDSGVDLKIGQTVRVKRVFTQADFDRFAELSGDDNPIHVDAEFAARTRFGRTAAHGMMLYGVICGLLSEYFPGAVQVEQEMMFPAPTFTDEEMTIQAEVIEIMEDGRQARLATTIMNPGSVVVCEGSSILKWSLE